MHSLSILVLEHEGSGPGQIRRCLEDQEGAVPAFKLAQTPEAALALLDRGTFDIILVDPELPHGQGHEAVRRLRAKAPDAAIIVISGQQCGNDSLAMRSVRFGAQDYLEKRHLSPFILCKSVAYAIERKLALQEKDELLADLSAALRKVSSLHDILSLCAGCQKILSSDGSRWQEVDEFLVERAGTRTEKLLCPACREQFWK